MMNYQFNIYSTVAPRWSGQDDRESVRQRRSLAMADLAPFKRFSLGFLVPSQSGKGGYVVSVGGRARTSDPAWISIYVMDIPDPFADANWLAHIFRNVAHVFAGKGY